MKLSPSTDHPPLKKTFSPFKGKFSFFGKKGKAFRWVFLISIFSLSILGLTFFLERVVEPRIGVNLTGELITLNEAAPPVLEKISPSSVDQQVINTFSSPEASFKGQDEKNNLIAPSPSHAELSALQEKLIRLEEYVSMLALQEEQHRKLGIAFTLLRQDIFYGLPFEISLRRFEELLSPHDPLRATLQSLKPFAQQVGWPLEKIIHQFSESYVLLEPEKTGFWATISAFIKSLWTVRRTDQLNSPFEQGLREAKAALSQGDIGTALVKLGSFSPATTPGAGEWFHQAQRFVKLQKLLRTFEQDFFQSTPSPGLQK